MVWLHGTLTIEIFEGRDLPGEQVGKLSGSKIGRLLERGLGKINASDAYVVLNIVTETQVSKSRFRTRVIASHKPQWNEKFLVDVADNVQRLQFTVKDDDVVGADFVGCFEVSVAELVSEGKVSGEYVLTKADGSKLPHKKDATVRAAVSYTSVEQDAAKYANGIGQDGYVPNVYFPLRAGNRVQLYHDAHTLHAGPNAAIPLSDGTMFEERSCWDDIFNDIRNAQTFIYVAGWSVVDHVHLQRDYSVGEQPGQTIGEMLKEKADKEKLKVCMLIWDDQTSNSTIGTAGVMMTKDEETKKFFKHSDVSCYLCPRLAGGHDSMIKSVATTTMFTHHQKIVVMDAPPLEGDKHRRVIAYIGGLDLTTGRYDTPDHPLFSTLHTAHKQDFYQGCVPGADIAKGGPRQPWHDIHSRLEGPIAWDVIENFHQRWEKQAGLTRRLNLVNFKKAPHIFVPNNTNHKLGDPQVQVLKPGDVNSWNVQLFRSIDSNSVTGFPEDNEAAAQMGLETGKGSTVEASIHRAYVYSIRRAQKFLYIENQYFLGSSQNWHSGDHPGGGADHLVPIEIALKVCQKIAARERFCAYIVIPPFPEGDPASGSVQEILYWQSQTMRMMYKLVGDALRAANSDAHPCDYLQFFWPGKREPLTEGEVASTADPKSAQGIAQASRRHMIYVHSKMLIADDEYIIVGSANINMRSLKGSRDSEIAVGCYQPAYTCAAVGGALPTGQVHGFRTTLWEEHLGCVDPLWAAPESVECARKVAAMANANWDAFNGDQVVSLPHGHLVRYPLQINQDGSVENLPGVVNFPDHPNASILGKNQALPDVLTT